VKLTEHRVGDLMELVRRPVDVSVDATYREIGLRSFGNGVFHKPTVSGEELGTKKVFRIESGDLIFSNVFAWEGAVALASDREAGMIGSHRFMTYQVNTADAEPRYLLRYFYGGPGLQVVRAASPGSAGRNRTLGIETFDRQHVKLPELAEQRRIADKLDAALSAQTRSLSMAAARAAPTHSIIDALEARVYENGIRSGWRLTRIGEFAEVNPRTARPKEDELVAFVPMAALSDMTGSVEQPSYLSAAEVGTGYRLFRRNDVIFARITPCMENGKTAVFHDGRVEYGFGSTEFHIIRSAREIDSRWIQRYLRTRCFRDLAVQSMTGTAGQQRVPTTYLRAAQIPLPPTTQEKERALAELDRLQAKRHDFHRLQLQQLSALKALRFALLDAAFSGQL
jgi:type I restriction enzyme S subunit